MRRFLNLRRPFDQSRSGCRREKRSSLRRLQCDFTRRACDAEVVHDHDVAGLIVRPIPFDISSELLSVDRSIEDARAVRPSWRRRRGRSSFSNDQMAHCRSAACRSHTGHSAASCWWMPRFIDENELPRVEGRLRLRHAARRCRIIEDLRRRRWSWRRTCAVVAKARDERRSPSGNKLSSSFLRPPPRIARRDAGSRLLAGLLADVHSVRIARQLALVTAFIVAAALGLNCVHPLDCSLPAVPKRLEARGHVEPGPVGSIGIDNRGPLARSVVTPGQQEESQE